MSDLENILNKLQAAAAAPFDKSMALPASSYGSNALFELEAEYLFRRGWMLVCRVDQVAERNSFFVADLLGEPVMVTRDNEGGVHVFSRVCPHRSAELVSQSGCSRLLVCPYHSWSFDMSGQCRAAPLMDEVEGFDRSEHGLSRIRHEIWNGFVFVNLSGDGPGLTERLTPLTEKLDEFKVQNFVIGDTVDFGETPYDWKVLGENAMECYHHIGTHAKSIGKTFPPDRSFDEAWSDDFVLTIAKAADDKKSEGAMRAVRGDARIVTVFPNSHFTVRPDGGTLLQVFPLAAGRSRVFAHTMVPREVAESPEGQKAISARTERMRAVLAEDWDVCRRVQQSAASKQGGGGRLSKYEHSLWLFYRYMAKALPFASVS